MKAFVLAWLLMGALGLAVDIVICWRHIRDVYAKGEKHTRVVVAFLTLAVGVCMGPGYFAFLFIHPPKPRSRR